MGTFPKTPRLDGPVTQAVLDALPGGLLYLDEAGRILGVQAADGFLLFDSLGVAPGRTVGEVLPPGLHRKMRHAVRHVLETREAALFEGQLTADGTGGTYQCRLVAGDDRRVLAVVHDVTERRELEAALLEISDRERQRLGQDFHDDIGQTLNGIWFMISSLQKKLAARRLTEAASLRRISSLLQRVMRQFRGLVRGLHAIELNPDDLVPALEAYAAGVEQIYQARGVSCSVVAPPACDVPGIHVATQFYRIAQEAIANAIRHGRATDVEIRLTCGDGATRLCVRDNGVGMPPAGARGHGFGLRIMAQRARLVGASLDVHPTGEGGTQVTCTLPHAAAKAASKWE